MKINLNLVPIESDSDFEFKLAVMQRLFIIVFNWIVNNSY